MDAIEDAEVVSDSGNPANVFHIENKIYKDITEQLTELIGGNDYIRATRINIEDGDISHTFDITAIIYHELFSAPDGCWSEISDIIPIWHEFHTYEGAEMIEKLNDFSIDNLKKYMI